MCVLTRTQLKTQFKNLLIMLIITISIAQTYQQVVLLLNPSEKRLDLTKTTLKLSDGLKNIVR